MNKQVQYLLAEVEARRGNNILERSAGDDSSRVSSSEESAAGQVISRHLVTFRDVEQLQQKNQQLLNVLRELSEKQEDAEKNAVDAKTAKIQQALESALVEIERYADIRRFAFRVQNKLLS